MGLPPATLSLLMRRLVTMNRARLIARLMMSRPQGDAVITNDLPNESGIPNHSDGAAGCACSENHDTPTGSTSAGALMGTGRATTCVDWTSAAASSGRPGLERTWLAGNGMGWIQAHMAAGCTPSVALMQSGGPPAGATGGSDGGIYCFAVTP